MQALVSQSSNMALNEKEFLPMIILMKLMNTLSTLSMRLQLQMRFMGSKSIMIFDIQLMPIQV